MELIFQENEKIIAVSYRPDCSDSRYGEYSSSKLITGVYDNLDEFYESVVSQSMKERRSGNHYCSWDYQLFKDGEWHNVDGIWIGARRMDDWIDSILNHKIEEEKKAKKLLDEQKRVETMAINLVAKEKRDRTEYERLKKKFEKTIRT